MVGHTADQSDQRPGRADVTRDHLRLGILNAQNLEADPVQCAGRLFCELFQGLECRKPLLLEFHRPCIDHAVQNQAWNIVPTDSVRQCLRYGMLSGALIEDALDRFVPPGEPNLTQSRFSDSIPNPSQFQIQGEKREEVATAIIRREQGGEITVVVVMPDIIVEGQVWKYVSHRIQIVVGSP